MNAVETMIQEMRAEQSYLGPDRESTGSGGDARWDRYERVVNHLEGQLVTPADHYHAVMALRLLGSQGDAGASLAEHLRNLLSRLNVVTG